MVIERPGIYGLIGPNGAGKTTLFDVITGATLPDLGKVTIERKDVTGIAPHRLKAISVARTFQECRVFPQFSCLENLLFALQFHRGGGPEEARRLLKLVNLDGYADEPPPTLSFVQRRLLEIVGTFIVDPRV